VNKQRQFEPRLGLKRRDYKRLAVIQFFHMPASQDMVLIIPSQTTT
jgi:hypothetical protein